jgi:hypothetical protein
MTVTHASRIFAYRGLTLPDPVAPLFGKTKNRKRRAVLRQGSEARQ